MGDQDHHELLTLGQRPNGPPPHELQTPNTNKAKGAETGLDGDFLWEAIDPVQFFHRLWVRIQGKHPWLAVIVL